MARTALLLSLLLPGTLTAQWSSSAAGNLLVADGASEQVQPKLAPTGDGGCYVSFFDSDPSGSPAFGYDVRLQRLDAAGYEQWPHGGVLVADRGFSSTQDYALAVDPATGDALLAFRDDRPGGTQITAARYDAAGNALWGAGGVQLTNTTSFLAAPKIDATTDGGVVVAWTQDADARVRKLDPNGAPLWLQDVVLTPAAGSYSASDLHAADSGAVILAIQHQTGGFTSPKHLRAQKFDAAGNPLWGAVPPAVFDGGSLQFGNFPTFVPDGAGGAVFAWYSASPSLECFAQRLLPNGAELYPHNGIAVSTNAAQIRVQPAVAFDQTAQDVYVVYIESNSSQSQDGVSAQRIDVAGARLWSANGATIVPVGPDDVTGVAGAVTQEGFMPFWVSQPSFAQARVYGARLDAAGAAVVAPFELSSTPATKYRLQAAASAYGFALLAWQDEGSGSADIAVQNALPDGTLGGLAEATTRNGSGVNPLCYTNVSLPKVGGVWTTQVTHSPAATLTGTFIHAQAISGTMIPGIGELLIDGPFIFSRTVFSTGTADLHSLGVPIDTGVVGLSLPSQAVVAEGLLLQLCNAIDIRVGL